MPAKKQITKAERRHRDDLRRSGLRVAAVYQGRLEKARRKELRRVLELAKDYQVDALADVIRENIDESGYLPGWWEGLFQTAGLPYAQDVAKQLRQEKAAAEDSIWLYQLRSYARSRAGNEITIVSGTWKDSLVKIVQRNLEAEPGIGIEKLTRQIYEDYRRQLERWQCRRIAQTEAMIGMADAGYMAAETMDVKYTKQWCISGLGNTRESHEAMDGVEVDQDEPFRLPGGLMMYPHDIDLGASASEIINCACDVIRRPKAGRQMQTAQQATRGPQQGTGDMTAEVQRLNEIMKELPDSIAAADRKAIAENAMELEVALKTKKGKVMTVAKADKQSANPKYIHQFILDPKGTYVDDLGKHYRLNPEYTKANDPYHVNCVTCSHAYTLRRRGFNVTAKGRVAHSGSITDRAAGNSWAPWKNADGSQATGQITSVWMRGKEYKTMTAKRYEEFFKQTCKQPGDYEVSLTWKGGRRAGRHMTVIHCDKNGNLFWIEPQRYDGEVKQSLQELCQGLATKPTYGDGVIRVDNKVFDIAWADLFDVK